MSTPTETISLSAIVPAELADQLRRIAEAHDRTLSAEVRRALREYADEHAEGPAA